MLLEQHLKILKSLKGEVRQSYKADLKGVFGSYVRGEAREDSDIDILVEFQEGATLFDLAGMGNFLEEKLQCKVDIVSQRAIREELKPYIYNELISL